MTIIRPGALLKDNDPRSDNRTVKVLKVSATHAFYNSGYRVAKISLKRIYDGTVPRHDGYTLVRNGNANQE